MSTTTWQSSGIALLVLAALPASAAAQSLTVQQPVVETFGVNTVVSVPDRGSVLLGSFSGASDSRLWNGFNPVGSSLGLERSHSSARAHVYIHDFAAMDEALLQSGTAAVGAAPPPRNPLAANAWSQLQRQAVRPSAAPPRIAVTGAVRPQSPLPTASSDAAANRSTNSALIPAASRAAR